MLVRRHRLKVARLVGLFCLIIFCALNFPATSQEEPQNQTNQVNQKNTVELPDFTLHENPLILNQFDFNKTKANVIIDGRALFEVGEFVNGDNSISASQRARDIEQQIQNAVDAGKPPEIVIEEKNGLPTISLNDSHLFTVTRKEIDATTTVTEKAEDIKEKITQSILEGQRERKEEYQYRQYITAALVIALAVTLTRIFNLLQVYSWSKAIAKIFRFQQTNNELDSSKINFLTKLFATIGKLTIWLGAVYWISDLFPQSRQVRYQVLARIWRSLNTPLFRNYSIVSILVFLALLWSLVYFTNYLTQILKNSLLNRTSMSRGSQEVIFIITQYGLLALGTIILLQLWGLNLSSLTILGSALGVGIGFGFQDIAKNFASGLVLLFERSVQVGDFIEVNGHQGTVEKVGARSIVLRTLDRVSIIVPNSRFLADEVVNWTHEGTMSRVQLPVGLAYGCDTKEVIALLLEAATQNSQVLSYPAPQVFLSNFGDSSLDFRLLVWIRDPTAQAAIKSELYMKIEELLTSHKIEIPFPQRDIHLRQGDLGFQLSPTLESALLEWLKRSN